MELDKRTWCNKVTGRSNSADLGERGSKGSCVLVKALAGIPSGTPSPAFGLPVIPALDRHVGRALESVLNPLSVGRALESVLNPQT